MTSLSLPSAKPRPRRRPPFDFDSTEDDLVESAIDYWLKRLNASRLRRWWRKAELVYVCENDWPDEAGIYVGEATNPALVESAEQGTKLEQSYQRKSFEVFPEGQIIAAQDVEGILQEPMYVPPQHPQLKDEAIRCPHGDWSGFTETGLAWHNEARHKTEAQS